MFSIPIYRVFPNKKGMYVVCNNFEIPCTIYVLNDQIDRQVSFGCLQYKTIEIAIRNTDDAHCAVQIISPV